MEVECGADVDMAENKSDCITLNDDCWLKVCEFLNFFDCLILAATCEQLDSLVQSIVIKRKVLDFRDLKYKYQNWMAKFNCILAEYGGELAYLKMDGYATALNHQCLDDVAFGMVKKWCSKGYLKSLTLEAMEIGQNFIAGADQVVLGNLKSLTIEYCRVSEDDLGALLAKCPALDQLKLRRYDIEDHPHSLAPLMRIASPNLQALMLAYSVTSVDELSLRMLFASQPNLKRFEYEESEEIQPNDDTIPIYDVVSKMLPMLRELKILLATHKNLNGISNLSALEHIRELNISVHNYQRREFIVYLYKVASIGVLTTLNIYGRDWGEGFNGMVMAICHIKSLRKLTLSHMHKVSGQLVRFAESLPLLEYFGIDDLHNLSCNFNKDLLLRFIANAPKVCRVKLHFDTSHSEGNPFSFINADLFSDICKIVRRRPQELQGFVLQCSPLDDKYSLIGNKIKIVCGFGYCENSLVSN